MIGAEQSERRPFSVFGLWRAQRPRIVNFLQSRGVGDSSRMTRDKLFNSLVYDLHQLVEELRADEAAAWKSPRNEVAYGVTKQIRRQLEEILRRHSASKKLMELKEQT